MISRKLEKAAKRLPVLAFSAILAACSPTASVKPDAQSNTVLTNQDQRLARGAFQNALEKSMSGKSVTWKNAATGASGSITPVKTWKTSAGVYCREYRERIRLASGQSQTNKGSACRSKGGTWQTA